MSSLKRILFALGPSSFVLGVKVEQLRGTTNEKHHIRKRTLQDASRVLKHKSSDSFKSQYEPIPMQEHPPHDHNYEYYIHEYNDGPYQYNEGYTYPEYEKEYNFDHYHYQYYEGHNYPEYETGHFDHHPGYYYDLGHEEYHDYYDYYYEYPSHKKHSHKKKKKSKKQKIPYYHMQPYARWQPVWQGKGHHQFTHWPTGQPVAAKTRSPTPPNIPATFVPAPVSIPPVEPVSITPNIPTTIAPAPGFIPPVGPPVLPTAPTEPPSMTVVPPAEPPSMAPKFPICNVCGDDLVVGNPDGLTLDDTISCSALAELGANGDLDPEQCTRVAEVIQEDCDCTAPTVVPPAVPPVEPPIVSPPVPPSTIDTDTAGNAFGKLIGLFDESDIQNTAIERFGIISITYNASGIFADYPSLGCGNRQPITPRVELGFLEWIEAIDFGTETCTNGNVSLTESLDGLSWDYLWIESVGSSISTGVLNGPGVDPPTTVPVDPPATVPTAPFSPPGPDTLSPTTDGSSTSSPDTVEPTATDTTATSDAPSTSPFGGEMDPGATLAPSEASSTLTPTTTFPPSLSSPTAVIEPTTTFSPSSASSLSTLPSIIGSSASLPADTMDDPGSSTMSPSVSSTTALPGTTVEIGPKTSNADDDDPDSNTAPTPTRDTGGQSSQADDETLRSSWSSEATGATEAGGSPERNLPPPAYELEEQPSSPSSVPLQATIMTTGTFRPSPTSRRGQKLFL